jgi:hypothetical protein
MFQEMVRDAYGRHFVTRLMVAVAVLASLLESSNTADSTEESIQESRPGNLLKDSTNFSLVLVTK